MSAFPHPVEGYQLSLDYEQSLFFLSPPSKTSERRKWPQAWLKARGEWGRPRFSHLDACAHVHSPHSPQVWRKRETARGLTPFISKTKFLCFHAPHRLKTTISTETNSFLHLLDLVLWVVADTVFFLLKGSFRSPGYSSYRRISRVALP